MKKLQRRIKAQEIVVLEMDKSSRLCVMPMSMYLELGECHVKHDPVVDWDEVTSAMREIKGHLRALNRIFKPGCNGTSADRVWKAKELKATVIPILSLLIKRWVCGLR